MPDERWARITAAFEDLTALSPAERDRHLAGCPVEDREELRRLLSAYDGEPGFLESPPALDGALSGHLPRQVGRYLAVREVGRGGMGVVYEAHVAGPVPDAQRRVALKIVHPAWVWPGLAARFFQEQRVLGRLEHPGITRLYDTGTTEDGTPYFAMEYVDGVTLDRWLETVGPSLTRRIRLFLQVCDAVGFAHRNLVVHRDLKPGNVLVGAGGQPKLLDFGIAKLLDPGERTDATQPLQQMVTPAFASPEQLAGEPVTTSSDLYSMGLLLGFLLTGQPVFKNTPNAGASWPQLLDDIPPLPSSAGGRFARQIAGDLDAIVLKCLRRRPEDRYRSIEDLANDLRAWLEHRPVVARAPSLSYRAGKFLRRNRVSVAAAALLTIAVGTGAASTLWQARIAQVERGRAQYRFEQIRRFSRSLLFEMYDSIADVPGSTPIRQALVSKSLDLLGSLERDASGDPELLLELAEGYRRLGNTQGLPSAANLGDSRGALESFTKALALTEQVLREWPSSPEALHLASKLYSAAGLAEIDLPKSSRPWAELMQSTIARMKALAPTTENTVSIAAAYSDLAMYKTMQGGIGGMPDYEQAVTWFERAPNSPLADQIQHAYALKRWGALLIRAKRLPEAEDRYRRALAIEDRLIRSEPQHAFDRTYTLSDLGWLAGARNDRETALRYYGEVLKVRDAELERDPKNVRFQTGVANTLLQLGQLEFAEKRLARSIGYLRRSATLSHSLYVRESTQRRHLAAANSRLGLAECLIASGKVPERGEARELLADSDFWRRIANPEQAKELERLRLLARQKGAATP
jgi:serine/threonine protein kinase